jgi:uncharacterized protein YdhG (YjbR/CyaY superfamily)
MSKAEVTAHLKKFDKSQRDALEAVRLTIRELLPDAEEVIKWNMPTFTINGKGVIGFDGFKNHNSIFPYSGSVTSQLKEEFAKYEQTKGSIHFDKEKPFPKTLLKKIVKIRLKDMSKTT